MQEKWWVKFELYDKMCLCFSNGLSSKSSLTHHSFHVLNSSYSVHYAVETCHTKKQKLLLLSLKILLYVKISIICYTILFFCDTWYVEKLDILSIALQKTLVSCPTMSLNLLLVNQFTWIIYYMLTPAPTNNTQCQGHDTRVTDLPVMLHQNQKLSQTL